MVATEYFHTKIVIVGAGFGGLGMGVALRKAGEHDFKILEKFSDVGGVWRDNVYPGCTCDVPSHLYSFSFAPYKRRDKRFPPQREILEYLQQVTDNYGLRNHLHLNTEVSGATFHQEKNRWEIITTSKQILSAEVVIFAAGQLHQPSYPHIPGLYSKFDGLVFHSARWQDDAKLEGKNVSIIGSGSSAAQMLPKLLAICSKVTMYQRTPHWVLPKSDEDFGVVSKMVLGLPGTHYLYRKALSYGADLLLSPVPRCKLWRRALERYAYFNLRHQVKDSSLIEQLTPRYPLGSKRIVMDSRYYPALLHDNVQLVTEPIRSIQGNQIHLESGESRTTDIIICATGFKASDFLLPMSVIGRDGHNLNEDWSSGAEAFLGLAIHGYPNLFLIAGPNSFNPAGSNPQMKELQIRYIMRCLRLKKEIGAQAMEVKKETTEQFQKRIDENIRKTIWPDSVDSWYKHDSGRVTNPWPLSLRAFKKMLSRPPERAFVFVGDACKGEKAVDFTTSLHE